MKYKIRKAERVISLRASKPIELDPKKFRNLKSFAYEGKTERDFINYISMLDIFNLPEDLDQESRELLESMEEDEMKEYSNSLDRGEDSWYEIGEEDESFSRFGGFKVKHNYL